jgi:hypothetical protein
MTTGNKNRRQNCNGNKTATATKLATAIATKMAKSTNIATATKLAQKTATQMSTKTATIAVCSAPVLLLRVNFLLGLFPLKTPFFFVRAGGTYNDDDNSVGAGGTALVSVSPPF